MAVFIARRNIHPQCYSSKVLQKAHLRALIPISLLLISLLACRPDASVYQAEYHVFGTQVHVSLAIEDRELADTAFTELQQLFQGLHHQLHAWEPSELTRLNQAIADGNSFSASPEILELISSSQALEDATGGRFNPAVGELVSEWGFHTSDFPVTSPPPGESFLQNWAASVPSTASLEIQENQIDSRDPRVQLDFGAIAKGYAVDRAIEMLQDLGIGNALVNAGGDLRAIGSNHQRPWRVAVQNPVTGELITVIEAEGDSAVFTSGGQHRYRQPDPDEPRWPHVLDPATGYPATASAAVTVVAETGLVADAWATALFVEFQSDDLQNPALHRVIRVDSDGNVLDSARRPGQAVE